MAARTAGLHPGSSRGPGVYAGQVTDTRLPATEGRVAAGEHFRTPGGREARRSGGDRRTLRGTTARRRPCGQCRGGCRAAAGDPGARPAWRAACGPGAVSGIVCLGRRRCPLPAAFADRHLAEPRYPAPGPFRGLLVAASADHPAAAHRELPPAGPTGRAAGGCGAGGGHRAGRAGRRRPADPLSAARAGRRCRGADRRPGDGAHPGAGQHPGPDRARPGGRTGPGLRAGPGLAGHTAAGDEPRGGAR